MSATDAAAAAAAAAVAGVARQWEAEGSEAKEDVARMEASGSQKAQVELNLELALGVSGSVRDNVIYVNEREVLCPIGQHLEYTDTETMAMTFIRQTRKVRSMCLAPNGTVLAVAEECASTKQAQISIHHVATQKKIRSLKITCSSEGGGGDVLAMVFSPDSKYLVSQSAPPTNEIIYWKWEGEKVMSRARSPVLTTRVQFYPANPSIITVSGPGFLRLWKLSSNFAMKLQPVVTQSMEASENFTDHCWTNAQTMVALNELGMCTVFQVDENNVNKSKALKLVVAQQLHFQPVASSDFLRFEAIQPFARGFVVVGASGYMSIFEETTEEQDEPYLLVKTFQSPSKEHLASVAVSQSAESMICYSKCNKLLTFPLGKLDLISEDQDPFRPFPFVQHKGPITAMDVCFGLRPLLVTSGPDRMVRIVNYDSMALELAHHLPSSYGDPVCLSIHPSGNMLAIGFKEHVRMYDILLGQLREKGCIFLKQCNHISFSHGGHLLACTTNLAINLYGTFTANLVQSFTEHIGQVRSLAFTASDGVLFSVGVDGAVYGRHVESGAPIEDLVQNFETCQLTAVACESSCKRVAATGSDGVLRELSSAGEPFCVRVTDGCDGVSSLSSSGEQRAASSGSAQALREKGVADVQDQTITSLLLNEERQVLFAGTSTGEIRTYAWPLSENRGRYVTRQTHNGSVAQLRVSFDGKMLFSTGTDGTVFLQRIYKAFPGATLAEIKALEEEQDSQKKARHWNIDSDSVLISNNEWTLANKKIAELEKQVRDVSSQAEYDLHVKDTEWMETVRQTRSESAKALQKERNRYEELKTRHEQHLQKHIEEKQRVDADRIRLTQNLENEYETRLGEALRCADAQTEAIEALRQKTDEILLKQETRHLDELRALQSKILTQNKSSEIEVERLEKELKNERDRNEEIRSQQEREYELEILKLKSTGESQVEKERQTLALKQGQLVQQQNKYDRLRNKMASMKASKAEDDVKISNLQQQVASLQVTLRRYERNLEEREFAFQEKEKTILHLRSNNRTLDNFRYVLDHRIEKLTEEKGPIQAHIKKLEAHIKEMYNELVQEFQRKKMTKRQLSNKDMKVEALTNEVTKLRVRLRERDREVGSLCHTISTAAKTLDNKDLMNLLTEAYHTQVLKEPNHKRKTKGGLPYSSKLPGNSGSSGKDLLSKGADGDMSNPGSSGSGSSGGASGLPSVSVSSSSNQHGSGGGGNDGSSSKNDGANADGNTCSNGGAISSSAAASAAAADLLLSDPADRSMVEESERQRDHMHKTVATLQKAVRTAERKLHDKSKRSLQENAMLIAECNRLRKESAQGQERAHALEGKVAELQRRLRKLGGNPELERTVSLSSILPRAKCAPNRAPATPKLSKESFDLRTEETIKTPSNNQEDGSGSDDEESRSPSPGAGHCRTRPSTSHERSRLDNKAIARRNRESIFALLSATSAADARRPRTAQGSLTTTLKHKRNQR